MKIIKSLIAFLWLGSGAVMIAGCSSDPVIEYGDAQAAETVAIGFGSTDLQSIAETMVDELAAFPALKEKFKQQRPVVWVDRVHNKTTEHVDTEAVTDTIQTRLLRSGLFRFVDVQQQSKVAEQLRYQRQGGQVDPATIVSLGRQIGARYMLYGNFAGIEKRNSKTKDVYYKFTLKLLDLETGLLDWAAEKEIRKTGTKPFFSF